MSDKKVPPREFNKHRAVLITGKLAGALAKIEYEDQPSWLDIACAFRILMEFHNQSNTKAVDTDGSGKDIEAMESVAKELAADFRKSVNARQEARKAEIAAAEKIGSADSNQDDNEEYRN